MFAFSSSRHRLHELDPWKPHAAIPGRLPTSDDHLIGPNEQRLFHLLLQQQQSAIGDCVDKQTLRQLALDIWKNASLLYYYDESNRSTLLNHRDPNSFPHGPVIVGMDRCQEFRRQWGTNATIGVAGLFNAGSNALTKNLQLNLEIPGNNRSFWIMSEPNIHGILSQVPWWKHNPIINDPVNGRQSNVTDHASVLPIVVLRDFYFWRKSMCTARYRLDWFRVQKGDCPGFFYRNATTTRRDKRDGAAQNNSMAVVDKHGITFRVQDYRLPAKTKVKYPSLVDLWNSFYNQYLQAPFPRLLIRFEDTLFHLPQIIQAIQECAGADWKKVDQQSAAAETETVVSWTDPQGRSIWVYSDAAKNHGNALNNANASSLLATLLKNVNPTLRLHQMNALELDYARQTLDPTLMKLFHYTHPTTKFNLEQQQ